MVTAGRLASARIPNLTLNLKAALIRLLVRRLGRLLRICLPVKLLHMAGFLEFTDGSDVGCSDNVKTELRVIKGGECDMGRAKQVRKKKKQK